MKEQFSSKNRVIRFESELVPLFRQVIDEEPDLNFELPPLVPVDEPLPWIGLRLDSQSLRWKPVYALKPGIPWLESLLAGWKEPLPPLVVTPGLGPRILEFCRSNQLSALDLNGRIYLRAKGLLVDRRNLPGRDFRYELQPRNIFVGKSACIIRSLLTDRDRDWSQTELVDRAKASSGLVSRIVQHLISQGYLEKKSPREFRLKDALGLIDAWVKADDFNRRTTTCRYTTFGDSPVEITRKLAQWANNQGIPIAFTQWAAGWIRHPYTEPVVTSAYVSWLPDTSKLEPLGLRPVNEAGKVWFHIPNDSGVFLETQVIQNVPLASDAQIYLDLQGTGLRGPDAAAALRNWEGFCRP